MCDLSLLREEVDRYVRRRSRSGLTDLARQLNDLNFRCDHLGKTKSLRRQIIQWCQVNQLALEAVHGMMERDQNRWMMEGQQGECSPSAAGNPEVRCFDTEQPAENRNSSTVVHVNPSVNANVNSNVNENNDNLNARSANADASANASGNVNANENVCALNRSLTANELSDIVRLTTIKTMTERERPASRSKLVEFQKHCNFRKVSYSGKPEERLKRFLNQLKEAFEEFKLSDRERIQAYRGVLSDKALDWFEGVSSDLRSSEEIHAGLIQAFLPLDYDANLKLKLLTDKMSSKISLSEYIRDVRCKNQELLHPLSAGELLEAVLRLMTSEYKRTLALAVTKFDSLAELTLAAKKADAIESQSSKAVAVASSSKPKVYEMEEIESTNAINPSFKAGCFKCGLPNHFAAQCPNGRREPVKQENPAVAVDEALVERIVQSVLEKLKSGNDKT